jgi:hypothetical protein
MVKIHAITQARVFDLKGNMFKKLSLYEQHEMNNASPAN